MTNKIRNVGRDGFILIVDICTIKNFAENHVGKPVDESVPY